MKMLTLLILTSLLLFGCNEKKPIETHPPENDRTESLEAKIESLQTVNDSLTKLFSAEKPEAIKWYEPLYDGKNLLRKGIANPAEFIEKSLREQPELIPIQGVLGGTMRFSEIQPVSSEWVIANYEDGHIEGRAIYSYTLNSKGKLEFKLLDAIEP